MKIFDQSLALPIYYQKHERTHTLLVLIFSLAVAPLLSILMIATCGINLVSTSISKLGWQNGMLPVVYLWGLYNLALFIYLLKLDLDTGKFTKRSKIFFYALTIASCVILLVGISIPFISDQVGNHYIMRKVHNAFATTGFVLFVVVLILLSASMFLRNKMHGMIGAGLMVFLIITGIFAVLCVNSPERKTFITAAVQMYIFAMIHVILAAHYFLIKFLPADTAKPIADAKTDEKDVE